MFSIIRCKQTCITMGFKNIVFAMLNRRKVKDIGRFAKHEILNFIDLH